MKTHYSLVIYYFCLNFCLTQILNAQTDTLLNHTNNNLPYYTDAAVVWRGFNHQWSYNHRINRLGNYINNSTFSQFPYQADLVHTSATGIGADVGLFDAQYTYVAMQNMAVQSGVVTIDFSGKEGDMHHVVKHLLIDSKKILDPLTANCTVLLNGFDILSEYKADKITLLNLKTGDAKYLPATNKISFDLAASLEVRCQSIECSRFNQKFNYTIQVHYLILSQIPDKSQTLSNLPVSINNNKLSQIITMDSKEKTGNACDYLGVFHTSEQHISRTYNWDKQEELDILPEKHHAKGIGGNIYPEAILAFKSISLYLDRAHWLLDWHSTILPEKYDPKTGIYDYSLDLLFKQWDEEMKHNSANPRISRFSSKKRGWAILEATVCLLQFENALVRHADTQGIVKWEGHNQSADANASIQRFPLLLNPDLLKNNQVNLYQKRGDEQEKIKQQYQQYVNELEKKRKQKNKAKNK